MKKLTALILALCLLCSCTGTEEPVTPQKPEVENGDVEIESEEVPSPEAEAPVKKELLKLGHTLGDFDSAEGAVTDQYSVSIPFEIPEGLENGKGENIYIPEETVNALRELCSDFSPDENWQNWVNYYTQDFSYGMLEFTYYIGNIATDKTVFCSIENGSITKVGFRNITAEVDGEELLERVYAFEQTHEQEKYEFKEGEEFLSEEVHYVYYYVPNKLIYGYQLFYYIDTPVGQVISNEYFSEYEIL